MNRTLFYVPLAIFLVMVVYFAFGLTRDARVLPSVLINKQVPPLVLKPIEGSVRGFSTDDLKNQVTLVNVFDGIKKIHRRADLWNRLA
jgi:cytochrome c biogenesis protein CcmG/thiol:disulfide interchange protein DsbE